MNIKSVKKQLNKVKALVSVMENEDSISSIEKDLLKSYVLKLYEQILDVDSNEPKEKKVRIEKVRNEIKKKAPSKSKPTDSDVPVISHQAEQKSAENFVSDFLSDPIEEIPNAYHTSEPTPIQETISNGSAIATEIMAKPEISDRHAGSSVMDLMETDEKIKSLFAESKSSELSDKLRNTPLKDINSALGLNERIRMINELFGKSNNLFIESIKDLNGMQSFAEAKKYLISKLIKDQGWTDKNKVHTAANFIKLVRRRYIVG